MQLYKITISLPNDGYFVHMIRARSKKAAIDGAMKLTNHDWDIISVSVKVVIPAVKAP